LAQKIFTMSPNCGISQTRPLHRRNFKVVTQKASSDPCRAGQRSRQVSSGCSSRIWFCNFRRIRIRRERRGDIPKTFVKAVNLTRAIKGRLTWKLRLARNQRENLPV
jgi:hypothetical protein